MDDNPDSIEKWAELFIAEKRNQNTARSYSHELNHFVPWVVSHTGSNLVEVLAQLEFRGVEEYLTERAKTLGAAALSKAHRVLSAFFFFLGSQGKVQENPLELITCAPVQRRIYQIPSTEEIREMLDKIKDPRDRAMLQLYYEGLTLSDVADLDVGSIDWDHSTVKRHWNGQKLPLGPWAMESSMEWRTERAALLGRMGHSPDCTPALFIGYKMKGLKKAEHRARLCPVSLDRIARNCVQDLTPRVIRIACAVHMLEAGATLRIVAAQLGVQLSAVEHMEKMATKGRYAM